MHGEVRIEDGLLSRRHAELRPLEGGAVGVIDLGSSNGTWVNGQRIAGPTRLGPGDVLRVGATELVVQPAAAAQPAPPTQRPAGAAPAAPDAFALSGPATRGAFRPHWGLRTRMLVTMGILALTYVGWVAVLVLSGGEAWVWAAVAVVAGVVQILFASRIGLAAVGGRVVTPAQAPSCTRSSSASACRRGCLKPRVAIADTPVPNALALGRSPRSATVCVTTSIMRLLTPAELEGVIAHELSHIRNRDVLVMTIAGFGLLAAGLMLQIARFSIRIFLAILLVVGTLWLVSRLLVSALSRHRELVADRDGALVTGRPSALASALMKVTGESARIPSADLRSVAGLNAFFIVPAGRRIALRLVATHPSLEERVAALQELELDLQRTA